MNAQIRPFSEIERAAGQIAAYLKDHGSGRFNLNGEVVEPPRDQDDIMMVTPRSADRVATVAKATGIIAEWMTAAPANVTFHVFTWNADKLENMAGRTRRKG